MASNARIDGALPDAGDAATRGLVFARGWAVEYNWQADSVTMTGQPQRLGALGFPAPFDTDLEGALRGRAAFSDFLYLFRAGQYLRLQAATLTPDGLPAQTATAWGLPAHWTALDAVVAGRGIKIGFCYFLRGAEYIRFDWAADQVSPGYPKFLGQEWHLDGAFADTVDGVVVGQSGFATKGYVFKTQSQTVSDSDGTSVPAGTTGSKTVQTPSYARYDFSAEASEGTVIAPSDVVQAWCGLLPLLDAGAAVDLALSWCNAALAALSLPATPLLNNALAHHFNTGAPDPAQLAEITGRMTSVRDRIAQIPDRFLWTPGFAGVAQTIPAISTEIGSAFSILHGPNGRAAVMIHEAVHFVFAAGGVIIDVPEFSGATINGTAFGISGGMAYSAISPAQAMANPSSYSAFAQEIAFLGVDQRFGAARPHE